MPHTVLPPRAPSAEYRGGAPQGKLLRLVQKSRITPEEAEEARAAAVKAARGARVHPRRILIEACVIFRLQITALQA
jgi:hypothetical protein